MMKKLISLTLALCMLLSFHITAFAAAPTASEKVMAQREASARYIDENDEVDSYTVNDCLNFMSLVYNGSIGAYQEDFLKSVADNLTENEGKIVVYDEESITGYACVMMELFTFGANYKDFNGYNLEEAMLALDPTVPFAKPYYYRTAIPALIALGYEELALTLAQTLTDNFYHMGSGMSYYPTSAGYDYFCCDNTASYVIATAYFYDDFKAEIDDALALLATYKTDGGYCSDPTDTQWGGNLANTDSTALVLAAYSIAAGRSLQVAHAYTADLAYEALMGFATDVEGEFDASYDKVIATRDALLGLQYYQIITMLKSGGEGWRQLDGEWCYIKADESFATGWEKINGKWYFFDDNAVMQTGWVKDGGKWYYLNASGAMATGWTKVDGKWYYLNASGVMQTGWQKVAGKWYYMNKSGVMQTGWQKIGGSWYYLNASGVMQTGWIKDGGKWYYLNASGAMRTANLTYKGKTYRFNNSGVCLNP